MKKHIPNILTLLNLFCGCCALVCLFSTDFEFETATLFLLASGVCDFLDGMVARLLNVKSEFGKEVDSLADMVSFGVVPGAIVYMLLHNPQLFINGEFHPLSINHLAMPAFIISAFSCYRLAKFNLDTRQTQDFIGLNTPSNTMFFIGLLYIAKENVFGLASTIQSPAFLYSLIPLSSLLLISEIPMFSMKTKGLGWKGNESRFLFLIISIGLLIWLKWAGLAFVVVFYILLNLFMMIFKTEKGLSVGSK
jgi:CDP-diacylglycerol---serine O-phosphatidyltransferase